MEDKSTGPRYPIPIGIINNDRTTAASAISVDASSRGSSPQLPCADFTTAVVPAIQCFVALNTLTI